MTRRSKPLIPQLNLGKIPSSYISNIKLVSDSEVAKFVNEIKEGPQIVSMQVPPYRHVFLLDIQPDVIMISDWQGNANKEKHNNWKQYYDIIKLVERKYNRNIKFYPVDDVLYKEAKKHNDANGGGGCSYYIFSWVSKRKEYISYQL
jgi:hypothetical protein